MISPLSKAAEGFLNLEEFGFGELDALDGERVVAEIDVGQRDNSPARRKEALLLTNKRILHLSGRDRARRASILSVRELDSVAITLISPGVGAFVWAALAVVLGVFTYTYIENDMAQTVATVAILGMGAYLVIDRLMDRGQTYAVFKSGGSQIMWAFNPKDESERVYAFINSVYRVKDDIFPSLDDWVSLH